MRGSMRGTSAASLGAAARSFEPALRAAGAEATAFGEQLFVLVDALDGSGSLRRALSDPSRSGSDKAALAANLLRDKADPRVVEVVATLVSGRWTSEGDLITAIEQTAFDAVLAAAQSGGGLEQVEDELFRLDRMLIGQRELRRGLVDLGVPAERRSALVRDLLAGKVAPATLQLVERAAVAPRGRSFSATLAMLGRLAAQRRELLVASATSAVALSPAQVTRLTELLERAYGRSVQLNIAVDPDVIGGLRVQVGSEVVDSTVLARLDDARRRLAG